MLYVYRIAIAVGGHNPVVAWDDRAFGFAGDRGAAGDPGGDFVVEAFATSCIWTGDVRECIANCSVVFWIYSITRTS